MLGRAQDVKIWTSFYLTRWLKPEGVLLDGLVRGLGRRTFTLTETDWKECGQVGGVECPACPWAKADGAGCAAVQRLIEKIDEVIRLAPNPGGIGDFLIRVRVFKRFANPGSGRDRPDWRRLLAHEFSLAAEEQNYLISRYYDWNHGDARARLANLLCEHFPTPDLPLVEVAVTSIGQLLVDLVKERRISLGTDSERDESVYSVPT